MDFSFSVGQSVRSIGTIVTLSLACLGFAQEPDPLLLERAVYLETTAGDSVRAERIYRQLLDSFQSSHRVRAEATFRLADLYARQEKFADAKTLLLQVLRDFADAQDLVPLAEAELAKVTAQLTKEEIGTNLATMHHLGDLAIALEGALENGELDRSKSLIQALHQAIEPLIAADNAPEVLIELKNSASEIAAALAPNGGGTAPALQKLSSLKEFQPFRERAFPSAPNDVFAPAWRMKDQFVRALAGNRAERIKEIGLTLEQYLAPVATLPTGPREGVLARLTLASVREARTFAEERKFTEARRRMDRFDSERHEQFPDFRLVPTLPITMPENAVAAEWVILYRAELARRELSRRAYATAIDHIAEALAVSREIQPRVGATSAGELVRRQSEALQIALTDAKQERLDSAQQALRRVTEKPQ